MIGCLRTCVHKQPIIALSFEFDTVLKFYNLEARSSMVRIKNLETQKVKTGYGPPG